AAAAPRAAASPRAAYPFGPGERIEYVAKFGILTVGSGSMSVAAIDTVRGVETFVLQFHIEGGALMFSLNDTLRSWVGTRDFISRRYRSDLREKNFQRSTVFEILPDSGYFRENDNPDRKPTVPEPLDDAAFFYFVRTTPLEVGKTYEYNRYFKKEKNPVRITVLKREDYEMPDGSKVRTLVLHPLVDDNGMFSRRAQARLWLTDDARRLPVQIRSSFVFGTITLKVSQVTLAGNGGAAR
ncbi:MAG: DUF3108 domain-containing protein, partial [Gemmatimonadota bacterium]